MATTPVNLDLKTLLQGDSVLITLLSPLRVSHLYLSVAIGLFLGQQGKQVTYFVSNDFNDQTRQYLHNIFKQYKLTFTDSLKDTNYVIAIDNSPGAIDKVSYDIKGDKFLLYITPASGAEFDFDNVDFQEGGGNYQAIFHFGSSREEVDRLLGQHPALQKISNSLLVDLSTEEGKMYVGTDLREANFPHKRVISFLHKELFGKDKVSKQVATLLLAALYSIMDPLNQVNTSKALISIMQDLLQWRANPALALKSAYFYQGVEWIDIYQDIYSNVQVASEEKVVWSVVDNQDLLAKYIDKKHFLGDLKLLFNMTHGIKVAFVVYYMGNGLAYVAIESDGSLNLNNFSPGFNYEGNNYKGVLEVRGADARSITSLLLEKVGVRSVAGGLVVEKSSDNGKIESVDTTDGGRAEGPGAATIPMSSNVVNNLIEPPPVVPM